MENTIVEYFAEHECYRCGYCHSPDTNYSHGMWAHTMTPEVYQGLIDRGWRRSGHYIYKPTNNITCCPTYPIRCHVMEFKMSKSQKKVVKRMNENKTQTPLKNQGSSGDVTGESHMMDGLISPSKMDVSQIEVPEKVNSQTSICGNENSTSFIDVASDKFAVIKEDSTSSVSPDSCPTKSSKNDKIMHSKSRETNNKESDPNKSCSPSDQVTIAVGNTKEFRPHLPTQNRRNFRLQKRKERLEKQGKSSEFVNTSKEKSLSDFIWENDITVILVPFKSKEFEDNFKDSHALYQKYQMKIHDDTEAECNAKQFRRFLCDSPLVPTRIYGSYHQLYKKNDQLIGVGVIDILPSCVSSVYFFYDPDLPHLSMGTYGALREIYFTQQLNGKHKDILYYYMGFYIHSCPKMKYKGNYFPSYLLCPETYHWILLDDNVRKQLDDQKYLKLSPAQQPQLQCVENVMILKNRRIWEYKDYNTKDDEEEISQYCNLVGNENARKMLLYRK